MGGGAPGCRRQLHPVSPAIGTESLYLLAAFDSIFNSRLGASTSNLSARVPAEGGRGEGDRGGVGDRGGRVGGSEGGRRDGASATCREVLRGNHNNIKLEMCMFQLLADVEIK